MNERKSRPDVEIEKKNYIEERVMNKRAKPSSAIEMEHRAGVTCQCVVVCSSVVF